MELSERPLLIFAEASLTQIEAQVRTSSMSGVQWESTARKRSGLSSRRALLNSPQYRAMACGRSLQTCIHMFIVASTMLQHYLPSIWQSLDHLSMSTEHLLVAGAST